MLDEVKGIMDSAGADFVITGEVLGQRPMSQRRFTLDLVARKCGLEGRLVRPLSGRLLPPTVPEQEGLIKREWLLNIEGRSRKRQMALAEEFGLKTYPNPAAGCLLTDKRYSDRLRDLLKCKPQTDFNDLNLLRVGRHFRLGPETKLVVGRDETENEIIESLLQKSDWRLEAPDFGSPVGLLRGDPDEATLRTAARVVARYCDGKTEPRLRVTCRRNGAEQTLETAPAMEAEVEGLRV
jgi:tRNA U34 2-thiouridine synthase MnmA/TrmU